MKIAIVEDEPLIVSFLEKGLQSEGYSTQAYLDGEVAIRELDYFAPDLVILDVMLPKRDGIEVLEHIRSMHPELPVIMLTARGDIPDRIAGLDMGANDYMVKPFSFGELAARIRAHLRQKQQPRADRLSIGDIELDLHQHRLHCHDRSVELPQREFALMQHFMQHPGQVLSRVQLLDGVWDYSYDPRSNVVDVYVGYLRQKLDNLGSAVRIDTIRGAGCRIGVTE